MCTLLPSHYLVSIRHHSPVNMTMKIAMIVMIIGVNFHAYLFRLSTVGNFFSVN